MVAPSITNLTFLSILIMINYYCCSANEHTFGYGSYDNEYFRKEVKHNRGTGLKNYTLIFNFLGEGIKKVTYVKIDVHYATSTGGIKVSSGKIVNAKINIFDVPSLSATISVRGESSMPYGYLQVFRDMEQTNFKSFTLVHVKNASPSSKASAQNAIGNRQDGDKLLHFESHNVTNFSRFPSRAFHYTGNAYITYVGFSFNSPTAIAMVNTSFVGDREFNAIAYDMNTVHFVANMSVYGIESENKPNSYLGIV